MGLRAQAIGLGHGGNLSSPRAERRVSIGLADSESIGLSVRVLVNRRGRTSFRTVVPGI